MVLVDNLLADWGQKSLLRLLHFNLMADVKVAPPTSRHVFVSLQLDEHSQREVLKITWQWQEMGTFVGIKHNMFTRVNCKQYIQLMLKSGKQPGS